MRTMQSLADQENPNVPADAPSLRAFNLSVGAAFMLTDQPDPRVWVVRHLSRDVNFERVYIWARSATHDDFLNNEIALNLDFNYNVAWVGHCVNPNDPDDDDLGVE